MVVASAGVSVAAGARRNIEARRLEGHIEVDGILDEAAWQQPHNNGLVQNEPQNGVAPTHPTDWWICYDDEALYVGLRMHDSAPDSIETEIARRDEYLNTDRVEVELDTFHDGRTGYLFRVTAGGAIGDATLYNDGWDDASWDAVWQSAARVDEGGWCSEIRIPFSQLRFPDSPNQIWGINVSRYVKRNQERDDLFHRPRNESGYVSRFPNLDGLDGLTPQTPREVLVYGVAKSEYLAADAADPFNDGSVYDGNLGADLRWGLSNSLTLNAAINPDFGQVEVDPAVVNLSDFETYFPERRPFFVQDSNLFNFGNEGTSSNWGFNWMEPIPFYSRRIGRSPQLSPTGDVDYDDTPQATTILGATKLTGTSGNRSFGVLTALTAEENHRLSTGGTLRRELAEPLTNYTVIRARTTDDASTRALGFCFTGTLRDLASENARASLARDAYTAGVDGWTYLGSQRRWALRGYVSTSLVQGSAEAIDGLQRSSQHYLQRPGAEHLNYDPSAEHLGGWAARVLLNKEKGNYTLNTAIGGISPGYEINDLGFQNRADYWNTHLAFGRRWSDPKGIFRNGGVTLAGYSTWDFGRTRTGGGVGLFYNAQFTNYWSVNGNFFYNPSAQNTRATRGGPNLRSPVNREFYFELDGDRRMKLRPSLWLSMGEDTAGSNNSNGGMRFEYKPSSALTLSVEPGFTRIHDDSQYVTTVEDAAASTFGHRYIFGDLDYKEAQLGLRVDWAFTPKLTLQGFAQPLLAVGRYNTLEEFRDPGGYDFETYGRDGGSTLDYDEAARQYTVDPGDGGANFTVDDPDFNFKSLRLNMVLRWEYSPGSTVYLVWTRDKTNTDDPGRMRLGHDLGSLLDAEGDDIVMIKVTRWLGI
jgi:hypothetical protein